MSKQILGFPAPVFEFLDKKNVDFLEPGKARMLLPPAITGPEITSFTVQDTTAILRQIGQRIPLTIRDQNIESKKVFGSKALFRKVCVKYRDPQYKFRINPLKITNMTLQLKSGRLVGNVENRIGNEGSDGEKGRLSRFRWQPCPRDQGRYDWSTVIGSADIVPEWVHDMTEQSLNVPFGTVRQKVSSLRPGRITSTTAQFESSGLKNVIKDLLNILFRGKVGLINGYNLTFKVQWKNKVQTFTRRVTAIGGIPVEGSINVDWA